MVKPENTLKYKKCPFGCDAEYKLVIKKTDFTSNGKVYKGDRWVYECPECKKGFTTTESDKISMKHLKVRKL